MTMPETVTLTMTREHAQVVQDACELLMRMKLGQTFAPIDALLGWPKNDDMDSKEYHARHKIADQILRAFYMAVNNEEGTPKDKVENMAYEVFGTIRHALYVADGGDLEAYNVAAQEPLNESGLTMPKCEVTKDAV